MKTAAVLGLLAETSIHPGTGRSIGVIDLPVAREAATDFPVLVGSSLKGALRDKMLQMGRRDPDLFFGKPDRAGDLLVSDARLLLLPVRSLTGACFWIVCPHLLERYLRDLRRARLDGDFAIPEVPSGTALLSDPSDESLFLEEREFLARRTDLSALLNSVELLVLHSETRQRLRRQLTLLNDNDFAWFVRFALPVQARNVLDDETKTSMNLWYEETLPPDTLFYALIFGRAAEGIQALESLFPDTDPYLQVGGNETVGQGWFAVTLRQTQR